MNTCAYLLRVNFSSTIAKFFTKLLLQLLIQLLGSFTLLPLLLEQSFLHSFKFVALSIGRTTWKVINCRIRLLVDRKGDLGKNVCSRTTLWDFSRRKLTVLRREHFRFYMQIHFNESNRFYLSSVNVDSLTLNRSGKPRRKIRTINKENAV